MTTDNLNVARESYHTPIDLPNLQKDGNDYDPFAPENCVLKQDFENISGVKKHLTTVPVRKPNKHEWVRVNPLPEYHRDFALLQLEEDKSEVYLVMPHVAQTIPGDYRHATLFTAVNTSGTVFLWPVFYPTGSRDSDWLRTSREGAEMAMNCWVRISANMNLGAYELREATGIMTEPQWPEQSPVELMRIAFRLRLIDTAEHHVLQRLRGEK